MPRIVLIAGFESFNADLYRAAAQLAQQRCPDLEICTFSDRDLVADPQAVEQALNQADVFFASLIFDYDQVLWLRQRVQRISIRLVFESALELISLTQIGQFAIGDQPKGMPKPVKFILEKFGNGREEDKLAGYLSFLKIGPKLLKFIPVGKVQDLRNWLIIYGYWNAGGCDNVAAMLWFLAEKYLGLRVGEIPAVAETPNMGLLHPDYAGYFESPKRYLDWYLRHSIDLTPETPRVAILLYRKHVITRQHYISQIIRAFEQAGLIPLPIFINGVEGHVAVRDWLTSADEQTARQQGQRTTLSLSDQAASVDAIVSTIGFPLVGGPAGSMEAGRQVEVAKRILSSKNLPYFVAAPLLIQDIHSWTRQGVNGLQSVVLYALPELDGAIDTLPLGGLVGDEIYLIPERLQRLTSRVKNWVDLRRKPTAERKLAIILYGFPPGYGATGTAALLNVPKSLTKLLTALQQQVYHLGELSENLLNNGEEILQQVKAADQAIFDSPTTVSVEKLERWLGYLLTRRIETQWQSLSQTGIRTLERDRPETSQYLLGGLQLGNIWIGVQPPLGLAGDPMRLMFERDLTPHPQYAAFYKWLQNEFQADAVLHFGMHGTVEWLPGSPLGNTGYSWPDILLGNLPNLYLYAANNPSESILAKRRGYGTLISYNVPPYGRAGLYKELVTLRDLILEYREDPEKNEVLKQPICKKIFDLGLESDCPLVQKDCSEPPALTPEQMAQSSQLDAYLLQLYDYLQQLEMRLFSSGLHVLGEPPNPVELQGYLSAYFGESLPDVVLEAVVSGADQAAALAAYHAQLRLITPDAKYRIDPELPDRIDEAIALRDLLQQTTDELTNLLRGLNGEYILPAPGGDLLRDGVGVLPTGRNIHALDPYRMPSAAAYERGKEIARKLIAQHLQENSAYPETVAVMLWGLDAIKTKGESLGILLELVGATAVKEGTGRIVRYELMPLEQLDHPRIDVFANLSGIFRDSFANIIELLDDLFGRAAAAAEPIERNYIRKHALELQADGIENSSARLFSNPAGDFGSLVNDRVTDSNWESGEELAQTWQGRNAFSYGRADRGQARPEVLTRLLQTTGRIVQQIDSVEYGLTDIQEYYANTGGLKKAAEMQQGQKVTASFVENFSNDTTPRSLEDLLRMEYRTKLLNPKWATAMAEQGSGGVYEISQRMTALIGWAGTADFQENWVYDQAAATYALDSDMAERLRQANPEAFRNIVGRMLEAEGRGFWQADPEQLNHLRNLYAQTDETLEGVTV